MRMGNCDFAAFHDLLQWFSETAGILIKYLNVNDKLTSVMLYWTIKDVTLDSLLATLEAIASLTLLYEPKKNKYSPIIYHLR